MWARAGSISSEQWQKEPFRAKDTLKLQINGIYSHLIHCNQFMSESRADLSLAAALRVMAPLVEMLLRDGVTHPQLAAALKKTFLDAAPRVLEFGNVKVNDSRLSTLTGIHRKDVRQWREVGEPKPQAKSLSSAMAVFTRWMDDPNYCDKKGRPRALARTGGAGTFEDLATSVSKDVHPQTILQELIRLGIVERVGGETPNCDDKFRLRKDAFVPESGSTELLQVFADNVADHAAAASSNLFRLMPPMLEQSVFADCLSPASVAVMDDLARQIWMRAFHEIVREATALSERDLGHSGAIQRVRIGMYMYHGPDARD